VEKEKKKRAPAAPKPPAPVEKLVSHALKLAATKPEAKWLGASPAALFSTKEANHEAAIAECTKPDAPLLKQVGKVGVLTAAGFEKIAAELTDAEANDIYERLIGEVSEEKVGALAKVAAGRIALEKRADFILEAIRRTPKATAELNPLLAEVNAAAKAEAEAKVAAALKEKQEHDAEMLALEETKRLREEHFQLKRDAIRRQWEALGGDLKELTEHEPTPKRKKGSIADTDEAPEPNTPEERDFRRYETDRLAAAWREAWDAKKDEGREYLETAMWNIRGFRMIGEVGAELPFDGRRHESTTSVFTDDSVRVVRPGWLLKTDDDEYIALKALVEAVRGE
jgi:hypothetical protein